MNLPRRFVLTKIAAIFGATVLPPAPSHAVLPLMGIVLRMVMTRGMMSGAAVRAAAGSIAGRTAIGAGGVTSAGMALAPARASTLIRGGASASVSQQALPQALAARPPLPIQPRLQLASAGPRPPASGIAKPRPVPAATTAESSDVALTTLDFASSTSWVDEQIADDQEIVEIGPDLSKIVRIELHASNQTDHIFHGLLRTSMVDDQYVINKKGKIYVENFGTITIDPMKTNIWEHAINTEGLKGDFHFTAWVEDLDTGERVDVEFSPKSKGFTFS